MITEREKLLTIKELAAAIGRARSYVAAMKSRGFPMPGGTASVSEARAWQARNPPPKSRKVFRTVV
jgi:hypothetical protein